MIRFWGSVLLLSLLLGYSFHFFVSPFVLFGWYEFLLIAIGMSFISFSIVSPPIRFIDRVGRRLFVQYSESSLRSLFIGLTQFIFLQMIGWHCITSAACITHNILLEKELTIDGATIVQTAGTIASLIFAAFQTVTASSENQYEVKGRLRFDQNDELYLYLRLTLSAAMGAFIGQAKAQPIVLPFAQGLLLLSILLLIPLISILFKSFKPEKILNKSHHFIKNNVDNLFLLIEKNKFDAKSDFEKICNGLMQVSIVASWGYKHKVHLRLELVRSSFSTTFNACFSFLKKLEDKKVFLAAEQEYFFEDFLPKRHLSIVNLSPFSALSIVPIDFPQKDMDFLEDIDLPLKILAAFFVPFKNTIINSLAANGTSYGNLHSLITEFILHTQQLKTETWRRSLYLMLLGEFTDGVLSLQKEHNAQNELFHLWFILLKARSDLRLEADMTISRHVNFCEEQFEGMTSTT